MNHRTLTHRDLWSLDDLSQEDILALIGTAQTLKRAATSGAVPELLRGMYIALLSNEHASPHAATFHAAASELGARVVRVRAQDPASACQRDPRDTAGLLGRLYRAIECQGLSAEEIRQIDRDAGVPVYNGIGSWEHPTRLLADVMVLQEASGRQMDEVVQAVRSDFLRASLEGGRLPLQSSSIGTAPLHGLGAEQARNHRHVIQALLVGTLS